MCSVPSLTGGAACAGAARSPPSDAAMSAAPSPPAVTNAGRRLARRLLDAQQEQWSRQLLQVTVSPAPSLSAQLNMYASQAECIILACLLAH